MSEALNDLVCPLDIESEESMLPPAENVATAAERPPHITPEEAALALARGPYVGRLAAAHSILRAAQDIELAGGYAGVALQDDFVARLRRDVVRREAELEQFERDWRWPPRQEQTQLPLRGVPTALRSLTKGGQEEWQAHRLCGQEQAEAFHPEDDQSAEEAKAVCRRCEVRQECLEYAFTNNEFYGIWGGLDEQERRDLLKERNATPA